MRYRKLDDNGDMMFGHQQADFYRNQPEAVAQAVVTRLKLWLDEWFLDMTEGTPYQQAILGKNKQDTIDPALRERILETQGLSELVEYERTHDPDTRTSRVVAQIDTVYGQTQITELL